jgi:hypothetical protein
MLLSGEVEPGRFFRWEVSVAKFVASLFGVAA